jgi:hypothetical protein
LCSNTSAKVKVNAGAGFNKPPVKKVSVFGLVVLFWANWGQIDANVLDNISIYWKWTGMGMRF